MAEYEQEGRPNQELTTQGKANQLKQHDFHGESAANKSLTEHDPFYTAFWERFVEKSSIVPLGEDPAFWPANMLIKFNLLEAQRGDLTRIIHEGGRRIGRAVGVAQIPEGT